jgi:hypothetical protein
MKGLGCNKQLVTSVLVILCAFPAASFVNHFIVPASRLSALGFQRSVPATSRLPFRARPHQRSLSMTFGWEYPDSKKKNSGEYGAYRGFTRQKALAKQYPFSSSNFPCHEPVQALYNVLMSNRCTDTRHPRSGVGTRGQLEAPGTCVCVCARTYVSTCGLHHDSTHILRA